MEKKKRRLNKNTENCFQKHGARLANRFLFLFFRIVFENKNKKSFSVVFFVKKVFGKLFLKIVFENRKQWLRRLDNGFQNSFYL